MDDLLELTAGELVVRMARRDLSAEELMQATLARIAVVNESVNAIVAMPDPEELLAEARLMDQNPGKGVLHGVPIAIKDLSNVAGMVTSEGSPVFADRVADTDSLHVARLRAAGAIFIGKTNTPEFGLGSHTFNPVYGTTVNAYDHTLSCGGSSGGAAVALATRMTSVADGSDMMGSLRNPAGWNNVYGFRPSWGRIPGDGEGEIFLHMLSTKGPMARCPADLALLMNVMAGPDPKQPHGMARQVFHAVAGDVSGKRIGWLGDWGGAWAMEDGILSLCAEALKVFETLGCVVEPVVAPFPRDALWDSWTTLRAWSHACGLKPLMENQQTRGQLKDSAIWEAERGAALRADEVQAASVVRSDWFRMAAGLFDRYDALVAPTAQVWPFALDQAYPREVAGQHMDTYHRWMEAMIPASLIGLPALAVPAGFGPQDLPMGIQLIGRHGDDQGLLDLSEAYHRETHWPQRVPAIR